MEWIVRKNAENKSYKEGVRVSATRENEKTFIFKLKPEKEVAEQLYLALMCYNRINSPKTIAKINEAEKRIDKLIQKEAAMIVKSL